MAIVDQDIGAIAGKGLANMRLELAALNIRAIVATGGRRSSGAAR